MRWATIFAPGGGARGPHRRRPPRRQLSSHREGAERLREPLAGAGADQGHEVVPATEDPGDRDGATVTSLGSATSRSAAELASWPAHEPSGPRWAPNLTLSTCPTRPYSPAQWRTPPVLPSPGCVSSRGRHRASEDTGVRGSAAAAPIAPRRSRTSLPSRTLTARSPGATSMRSPSTYATHILTAPTVSTTSSSGRAATGCEAAWAGGLDETNRSADRAVGYVRAVVERGGEPGRTPLCICGALAPVVIGAGDRRVAEVDPRLCQVTSPSSSGPYDARAC